jgi:uncharacterized protein YdeI (BOF family)
LGFVSTFIKELLMIHSIRIAALSLSLVASAAWAQSAPQPVTPINDVQRGSMVTVEGTVDRITDTDTFRLRDATGSIRVDVGYPNFVPVQVGETVRVIGFVDRDPLKEIYAREIVHADGRVSRLERRY